MLKSIIGNNKLNNNYNMYKYKVKDIFIYIFFQTNKKVNLIFLFYVTT